MEKRTDVDFVGHHETATSRKEEQGPTTETGKGRLHEHNYDNVLLGCDETRMFRRNSFHLQG